jgi:hypothetical protein
MLVMVTMSVLMNVSLLSSAYVSLSVELGATTATAPVVAALSFDPLLPTTNSSSSNSNNHNTNQDGFGACLLIMDDNHRLTEWLAYHYHVLPLQYLVVAVDPGSETSPSPILDFWRRRHADLQIVEWNATDIYQGKWNEHLKAPLKSALDSHKQRQNMFLRNCLRHMKQMNRTWVAVLDSDEFLHFNGNPGQVAQPDNAWNHSMYRLVVPGISYPSMHTKASIWNFLKYLDQYPQPTIQKHHPLWQFYRNERGSRTTVYVPPCITIPRLLFGTVESTRAERYKGVPGGERAVNINPNHLSTLRHRKHVPRKKPSSLNGWAKVMVDVSRVAWEDFPSLEDAWRPRSTAMNVHKPIRKHCSQPYFKDNGAASLFRINHYVGSYEAFTYRMDARSKAGRGVSTWEKKASVNDETDDNIRPWLSGFVEYEGLEQAEEMLFMAGHFTPKPPKEKKK